MEFWNDITFEERFDQLMDLTRNKSWIINDTHCSLSPGYIDNSDISETMYVMIREFLYGFMYIFSMVFMGLSFSICFIANFAYKPLVMRDKNTEFFFEDMIPYEEKYIEEYQKLDCEDLKDEKDNEKDNEDENGTIFISRVLDTETAKADANMEKKVRNFNGLFVKDTSPAGDVMLFYNAKEKTFLYYSERREIPFKYLETLARLFVCTHKCKDIYIDYIDEYRKAKNKIEEAREAREVKARKMAEEDDEKEESVFAIFKKQKIEKEAITPAIITERCNKYIYKGKIKDYEIEEEKKRKALFLNEDSSEKKMSFSEFKKYKKA